MQPEFTHRQSANIISSLMDRLKIEHFNAMGMSSGGMILLHMAVNQPSRINSMILISATHYFPEQAKAIMRRASYRTLPAEVLDMYQSCATRGEEQIRDLIGQFNAFGNSVDDMNLTTVELSTINSRVLILHGERDQFFPIEIQKEIADSIKNSELIIFANGEHVPVFEHQASFVAAAHRFLLERQ